MKFEIRQGIIEDQEWLYKLYCKTMKNYVDQTWGWDEDFQKTAFPANLPAIKFKIITISQNDLGAYFITEDENQFLIEMILIDPENQRKGIGRELIKELQDKSKKYNKPLRLSVLKVNPARYFYASLYFRACDQNETSIKMEWSYKYIEEKINWITKAKKVFHTNKPKHFTNFTHCEECAEHDKTLLNNDVNSISLTELGNPGWDPICFTSEEGIIYYFPALIRLSLDTITTEFYLSQFLFHLRHNSGKLAQNFNKNQSDFLITFLRYLIENYPLEIEDNFCTDEILNIYSAWIKIKK